MPLTIPCLCTPGPVSSSFALLTFRGAVDTQTSKLNYATNVVTNGTSLPTVGPVAATRGNSVAIFAIASGSGSEKYTLATNVTANSASMARAMGGNGSACGAWYNSVNGFYFGSSGAPATAVSSYTFATDASTLNTSLAGTRFGASAAGNTKLAIVAGGFDGGGNGVASTEVFDMTLNTVVAGTALGISEGYRNNAISDLNTAYFIGGSPLSAATTACVTNNKAYAIVAGTVADSTALGGAQGGASNASGPLYGVLAGGWNLVPGAPVQNTTIQTFSFSALAFTTLGTAVTGSNALYRVGV
jgi:hypothetical protein